MSVKGFRLLNGDIEKYDFGSLDNTPDLITEDDLNDTLSGYTRDVQINGTSIVEDGVANMPVVTANGSVSLGLVRPQPVLGTGVASNGGLAVVKANKNQIKSGSGEYTPIVPINQHESTFYGLAKAAGDTTQSASSNEVGQYTDEAKTAIKSMLGVTENGGTVVNMSGTDVTIDAYENTRYLCGELVTLSITPPNTGIVDVVFTSGSTPTVVTLPSTVKMPDWYEIEANKIYEISIMDGIYGAVMSWDM